MSQGEPTEDFIEGAGLKIHLLRGGHGRPLVLLHSVEGNLGWPAAYRELAERYEVYAPTHPGFGRSERPDWLETIADLAHFYLWFLQELNLDQVSLAGHFLGGWLAAEIAIRCPHVLDRLILIDAAGIKPRRGEITDIFLHGPEETRRLAFVDPGRVPEYSEIFDRELTPEAKEVEAQNQEMAARLCWKPYMHNRSLPYLLPRLRVPTLVVWGREDKIVPLECGERYGEAIPGARLAALDQCGHFPQLEKPGEFTRAVVEFLAKG